MVYLIQILSSSKLVSYPGFHLHAPRKDDKEFLHYIYKIYINYESTIPILRK